MEGLGDHLYRIVTEARGVLFNLAELTQLTYGAFNIAAQATLDSEQEEIEVSFPIGYHADKTPMEGKQTYRKEVLVGRYQFLAFQQLPVNGVIQLVTVVEAALNDLVRAVVLKYPKKLGAKRSLSMSLIFESTSIEEVHLRATDGLINELTYKSPTEYAVCFNEILPINLLSRPEFHKYIEIKATRDIYIHNQGKANELYVRKAGTHARVKSGMALPANIQYFLESYEICLQLLEWLEVELHEHWHSPKYEEQQEDTDD